MTVCLSVIRNIKTFNDEYFKLNCSLNLITVSFFTFKSIHKATFEVLLHNKILCNVET